MIAFVTGAHGFIGRHLVERLKQMKWHVYEIDRDGNLPLSRCDYLFDLAAYGNYHFQDEPSEIFSANIMRLITMLAQLKRVKGIVLTSSSSTLLPVKTFYSVSKQAIEGLAEVYDLPIVVARPSTIVGPGEAPNHLIPMLISGKIKEFVSEPKHDYLSVYDYIEAIILMARNAHKLRGKTLNVSSGKSVTNKAVREIVEKVAGKKIKVKLVKSLRKYDTKDWKVPPAIELTKLGWRPSVSLKATIKSML